MKLFKKDIFIFPTQAFVSVDIFNQTPSVKSNRKVLYRKSFTEASLKWISFMSHFWPTSIVCHDTYIFKDSRLGNYDVTKAVYTCEKTLLNPRRHLFICSRRLFYSKCCVSKQYLWRGTKNNKTNECPWHLRSIEIFYDNFHLISTHKRRQITLEHAYNYKKKTFRFSSKEMLKLILCFLFKTQPWILFRRNRGWSSSFIAIYVLNLNHWQIKSELETPIKPES